MGVAFGARIGEGVRVTSPQREIRRIGPNRTISSVLRCPHDCEKPRTRANFARSSGESRTSQTGWQEGDSNPRCHGAVGLARKGLELALFSAYELTSTSAEKNCRLPFGSVFDICLRLRCTCCRQPSNRCLAHAAACNHAPQPRQCRKVRPRHIRRTVDNRQPSQEYRSENCANSCESPMESQKH